MKKYVKPELFYEHFELNTHIADCMFEVNNQGDPQGCTFIADENYGIPGAVVFTTIEVCGMEFEGSCYYPGTDGTNTFAS